MKSDREWLYWGERDPMWGVYPLPERERAGRSPWTAPEFLATGKEHFREVLRHWRHYGVRAGHCLEIGCGSGRLTRQLAGFFARVTAVDISPHQLENARALLGPLAAVVCLALAQPSERSAVPDGEYDAMLSCEVFQHFSDYGGIERYLRDTHQHLRPGATICFQIPLLGVHSFGTGWYLARRARTAIERTLGRKRLMDYRAYPAARIFRTLREAGYRDAELRVFPDGLHPEGHAYFFARRAKRLTAHPSSAV